MNAKELVEHLLNPLGKCGALNLGRNKVSLHGLGTPVFDLSGRELFRRYPIIRRETLMGYADVSSRRETGSPLLAVNLGEAWNEERLRLLATSATEVEGQTYDQAQFVAFDYPRIGLQFLSEGKEVLMLDLGSLQPVAEKQANRFGEFGDEERWSLLDRMPEWAKVRNRLRYEALAELFEMQGYDVDLRKANVFNFVCDERRVAYSLRSPNHACFERRKQEQSVWCVPACMQMILDFYRYEYDQSKIACYLKLGTPSSPRPLPLSEQEFGVIRVIDYLSGGALEAEVNSCPFSFWDEIVEEIGLNHPLMLFSIFDLHARVIVGYCTIRSKLLEVPLRYVLLFDPSDEHREIVCEDYDAWVASYRELYRVRLSVFVPSVGSNCN